MARTATYRLNSKTKRQQLLPRRKPYYTQIAPGITLGYLRKPVGSGTWIVRALLAGRYRYETLGAADDQTLPNGKTVLSHAQAVQRAGGAGMAQGGTHLTVRMAMENYLSALASKSTHAEWARTRAENHILPKLGDVRVDRLTKTQIEEWRAQLVRNDPRDPDAKRRSQDTANRLMTVLRAALNHALTDEKNNIQSDAAWRRVKQFRGVARPRADHFATEQVRALITAAATFDKPLATLIAAGYLTGARVGELVALDVRDLDARNRALHIQRGKTGPRICTLSGEAVALLTPCASRRPPTAPLLPRTDGQRWQRNEQLRPFKRAAAMAGLPESASFYSLRHSYISACVVAGQPLPVLAENVGTSVRVIEATYFKAKAETRRQLIEDTAPKLRLSVG